MFIAEVYSARGERDSAFAWLMNGQYGMQGRLELRTSHHLDSLRKDPRFPQVMHMVGLQ